MLDYHQSHSPWSWDTGRINKAAMCKTRNYIEIAVLGGGDGGGVYKTFTTIKTFLS